MSKIHKFLLRLLGSIGLTAYKGIHGTKHEHGVQIVEQQCIKPSNKGFYGNGAYFWLHAEGSDHAYLLAKDWWWQAHCSGSPQVKEQSGNKAFFPVLATLKVRPMRVLDLTDIHISTVFKTAVNAQLALKYPNYQSESQKTKADMLAKVSTDVVETLSRQQEVYPAILIAPVKTPKAKWREAKADTITGNGNPCIVIRNHQELIEYNLARVESAA